jgi:hypothetical protein
MSSYKKMMIAAFAGMLMATGCTKDDDPGVELGPIVLDCNFFESDQVLEDDPNRPVDFIVPCVARVLGNIVIKPSVVIEFEDDAGLKVDDGYLKVEGTAAKKVVFTGVTKVKGSWRGIYVYSESVNNVIDHAVISYGGGNSFNSNNDRGNLICYTCKISVTNSTIDNGKEHGFNSRYTSSQVLTFENNTVTDNDKYPIFSVTNAGHNFNASNDFTGNAMDFIFLKAGQGLDGNRTWENSSVPYLVDGQLKVENNESLTIEAGTSLLFEDEGSITVRNGGFLATEGTSTNMVLLSGIVEQPGSWRGILNESDDQRNVIDYTEIAYAGGGAHNSNGDLGTIVVWANAYQTVTNSILRDNATNASCAINAQYNGETLILTNNTITNIATEDCQ